MDGPRFDAWTHGRVGLTDELARLRAENADLAARLQALEDGA